MGTGRSGSPACGYGYVSQHGSLPNMVWHACPCSIHYTDNITRVNISYIIRRVVSIVCGDLAVVYSSNGKYHVGALTNQGNVMECYMEHSLIQATYTKAYTAKHNVIQVVIEVFLEFNRGCHGSLGKHLRSIPTFGSMLWHNIGPKCQLC